MTDDRRACVRYYRLYWHVSSCYVSQYKRPLSVFEPLPLHTLLPVFSKCNSSLKKKTGLLFSSILRGSSGSSHVFYYCQCFFLFHSFSTLLFRFFHLLLATTHFPIVSLSIFHFSDVHTKETKLN